MSLRRRNENICSARRDVAAKSIPERRSGNRRKIIGTLLTSQMDVHCLPTGRHHIPNWTLHHSQLDGRTIGLDHKTVDRYLCVLEQIYLVQRVLPWSRNELSRLVKTPKLHFVDSGLLTAMRGYSVARLSSDRSLLGPLLETFVFSELLRGAAWAKERVSIFHYRDKDQLEVDFVLENTAGQIVGIEVKAAASVTGREFTGLERIASAAGSAFVQGILLYDGEQTLSFGEKFRAVPLPVLWA
jgi:uncharacterized protein